MDRGRDFVPGERVGRVLDRLAGAHELRQRIIYDNGPEFLSFAMAVWAEERNVEIDYIETGMTVQNCLVESFNGKLRDECLNENLFTSIGDRVQNVRTWRKRCNAERPRSSLGRLTPRQFSRTDIATGTQEGVTSLLWDGTGLCPDGPGGPAPGTSSSKHSGFRPKTTFRESLAR